MSCLRCCCYSRNTIAHSQLNQTNSTATVATYLDDQFDKYMLEELKSARSLREFPDRRVHVCLYFIAPTGRSLKSIDLVTLKELHHKVTLPTRPIPLPQLTPIR